MYPDVQEKLQEELKQTNDVGLSMSKIPREILF